MSNVLECAKCGITVVRYSTTVVMVSYGLPWKWRSLTPFQRHPSEPIGKIFGTIDYAFDLNDLAKFGFGRIFGDWGTTSCSMYDMSVTVWHRLPLGMVQVVSFDSWQCRRYSTCTLSLRLLWSGFCVKPYMYPENPEGSPFGVFWIHIWFNTKIVFKNIYTQHIWVFICIFFLLKSEVGAEVERPPILILPRAAKCLRPGLVIIIQNYK